MDFNRQFALRRLIVLMDSVSIVLSMVLAAVTHASLRSHFDVFKGPPSLEQYLLIGFLTMPLMLGLVAIMGLHRQFERPFVFWRVTWDQVKLHLATLVGISLIVFLTQVPLNRSVVGLFLVYTFIMMLGSRLVLNQRRRRSHSTGHGQLHLLLVGSDSSLVELLIDATKSEDLAPKLVGILETEGAPVRDALLGVPILGAIDALERVLHEETVDEVVLATRGLSTEQFGRVLAACDELGTPMRQLVLPEFHDGRKLGLERQYGLPFVTLVLTERSTEAVVIKRAVDLVGSSCALLLLSPVILTVALLILLTMGRPILFSQDRIGYHGRRFRMHKFRSMVNDAEKQRAALSAQNEMSGPVFKIAADPRITPLGSFIRRYSLDELPQLFNVFSGSMSLVGPRPLPVAEQRQISGPMRRRLSMKPGITGLWQVSGRSNLSFDEWMKLDLEYVDNSSLRLDLELLLKTIPAVILGRGAV
jgi:exopolysaccharide biosynthesis polyprenyl glycosylphosphotransferase